MGRRIIAIAVAAVLALVGVVSVVLYAKGADQRAVAGAQPAAVYVSLKPIPAGTSLSDAVGSQALARTELPGRAVPVGVLTDVTDANKELLAITDIAPGEYVLSARFGTTPQGSKAIQVPTGQVAVSVALGDQARVGQFVTPGSHLVIYDTFEAAAAAPAAPAVGAAGSGGTKTPRETRVLLDDVLVIAMGATALTPVNSTAQPAAAGAPADATKALVTLAVDPDQAARLVHGIQTGSLYAGLRGSDAKINTALTISDASVFTK